MLEFLVLHAIGTISFLALMLLGFPNPSRRRWLTIVNWVLRIEAIIAAPLAGVVYYKFALGIIYS